MNVKTKQVNTGHGWVSAKSRWILFSKTAIDFLAIVLNKSTTTKCIFSDEKIRHQKSKFSSLRTFSGEIRLLVTKLISSLKVICKTYTQCLDYCLCKKYPFSLFYSRSDEEKNNHYLPIIMLTTSFIFAPFPTCPRKKDFFPKTSKNGIASSYNACIYKQ